jgi:hypothetical protein
LAAFQASFGGPSLFDRLNWRDESGPRGDFRSIFLASSEISARLRCRDGRSLRATDPVDRGVGVFACPAEIRADGDDAEHAASSACSLFLLRPAGLPDRPFRKPACNGGRPGPAL